MGGRSKSTGGKLSEVGPNGTDSSYCESVGFFDTVADEGLVQTLIQFMIWWVECARWSSISSKRSLSRSLGFMKSFLEYISWSMVSTLRRRAAFRLVSSCPWIVLLRWVHTNCQWLHTSLMISLVHKRLLFSYYIAYRLCNFARKVLRPSSHN